MIGLIRHLHRLRHRGLQDRRRMRSGRRQKALPDSNKRHLRPDPSLPGLDQPDRIHKAASGPPKRSSPALHLSLNRHRLRSRHIVQE